MVNLSATFKRFFLVLALLKASLVWSQHGGAFHPLAQSDQLSHSLVNCILQDKEDFIWIGTMGGLNRFDGANFEIFRPQFGKKEGIYSAEIKSLFQDSQYRIWVRHSGEGVSMYNLMKNRWFQFLKNENPQSISSNQASFNLSYSDFVEDCQSRIWIRTTNGLNEYLGPGLGFRKWFLAPDEGDRLKNNITCVKSDDACNLWVGTKNGLFVLRDGSSNFEAVPLSQSPDQIVDVTVITQWGGDRLLVGSDSGLFVAKKSNNYIFQKVSSPSETENLDRPIRCIAIDHHKTAWVGTDHGVMIMDRRDSFLAPTNIKYGLHEPKYRENGFVLIDQICVDSKNTVWVRTNATGAGLFKFDRKTKTFVSVAPRKSQNPADKPIISFLLEDSKNVMWVGTWKEGVYINDLNAKPFNTITLSESENTRANDVYSIFEDDDRLLIGSSLGLFSWQEGVLSQIERKKISNTIGALQTDQSNHLWIGFLDHKISQFWSGKLTDYDESFQGWSVRSIEMSDDGDLWIASASQNGLINYKQASKKFYNYRLDSIGNDLDNWINVIVDEGEFLWLGTQTKGLVRFHKQQHTFEFFSTLSSKSSEIHALYIQNDSCIWMGTPAGLLKLNPLSGASRQFLVEDGLPSNFVVGILPDDGQNLWISTHAGLSRLSLKTHSFINYSTADGLAGDEFNKGAYYKSKKGILYFGGVKGVTYFDPDQITANKQAPTVHITALYVRGQLVKLGEQINDQVILDKPMSLSTEISLNHVNNSITLEFVGLQYSAPKKVRFQYMLKGFDQKWNTPLKQIRQVTYTNLPPGNYTFEIKAYNPDGLFFEKSTAKLSIIVIPPFWQTIGFKVAIIALLVLIFIMAYRYRTHALRVQKNLLQKTVVERTEALSLKTHELEMSNWELQEQKEKIVKASDELKLLSQRVHEADLSKIKFFTNISHELRTPLTLILGPLEQLIMSQNFERKDVKTLQMIDRNGQQLLKLINQLLDLSKLEAGHLTMRPSEGDLIATILEVGDAFRFLADSEQIDFTVTTSHEQFVSTFDQDKLEKILNNLLSNAFKFTSQGGKIVVDVNIQTEKQTAHLSVFNEGYGIPAHDLERVFEYYYQSSEGRHQSKGTGIGLALVKSLVEGHGGEISVESGSQGTTFYLSLQLYDKNAHSNWTMVDQSFTSLAPKQELLIEDSGQQPLGITGLTILLVDDNEDIRTFLSEGLETNNRIITAGNGIEAIALMEHHDVDIIISDVMMPQMNGIELCRRTKKQAIYSDIPIILLTAKVNDKDEIEGLHVGADDYVTKPFSLNVLKLRMAKIIATRNRIQKLLSADEQKEAHLELSPIDSKFVVGLDALILDHLHTNDLNGDMLAEALNMSKGHLYRKVKAMTGYSVHVYIKNFRLKKAAQLIRGGEAISQAAYAAGFDSLSYFTRSFSKFFGVTPSGYKQ